MRSCPALGLGRRMPLTGACASSRRSPWSGVPPAGGFFSKWYLLEGAIAAGSRSWRARFWPGASWPPCTCIGSPRPCGSASRARRGPRRRRRCRCWSAWSRCARDVGVGSATPRWSRILGLRPRESGPSRDGVGAPWPRAAALGAGRLPHRALPRSTGDAGDVEHRWLRSRRPGLWRRWFRRPSAEPRSIWSPLAMAEGSPFVLRADPLGVFFAGSPRPLGGHNRLLHRVHTGARERAQTRYFAAFALVALLHGGAGAGRQTA